MEKRIIYCWFGGKEKPEAVQNCINSWKQQMPDWEYLEINESNFDINYSKYCKDAYDNRHWAYVSDIARLWALYEYGGIYMDTDVICYKPLDKFLKHEFFTGFEQPHFCVTATMGANKGNKLIKEMLDIYDTKVFETHENWGDYETNTMIMSDILGKYFNRDKVEYQEHNNMTLYPRETFCAGEINEDTYTRHLMFASWVKKIPKRIIYVWVGKEKPDSVKKCIASWKKYMPDWEYLEINENNFDISSIPYSKDAYDNKMWGFVGDPIRMKVLYEYGGIYLDTDVEVYQSLEPLLNNKFFVGFEQPHYFGNATIGAEKGNPIVKELFDAYEKEKFIMHDNWWEYRTGPMVMTDVLSKYVNRDSMEYQKTNDITVYPKKYFCNHNELDNEVYCKHLMNGLWCE